MKKITKAEDFKPIDLMDGIEVATTVLPELIKLGSMIAAAAQNGPRIRRIKALEAGFDVMTKVNQAQQVEIEDLKKKIAKLVSASSSSSNAPVS